MPASYIKLGLPVLRVFDSIFAESPDSTQFVNAALHVVIKRDC